MMVEKVNKMIEEMEKLEKNWMGMLSLSDLSEIDDETMKMFKSSINLMNLSKDLMIEQAETIDSMVVKLDSIDQKLDALLDK